MATEEIRYTIPADSSGNPSTRADVVFTYDPTRQTSDGSFSATGASGTYQVLSSDGIVVSTHTITGLEAPEGLGDNDNRLFVVSDPAARPTVTNRGITYTIDSTDDSNDGYGNVNLYDASGPSDGSVPNDTPAYREDGPNTTDATDVSTMVVCFASGTHIRTSRGEVVIETLKVGDFAVTASGRHRRIRWIGQRAIDCRRHPRPLEAMPVRIAAHAFGENRPTRALRVSPGHSLCVDVVGKVLIPAGVLINGATIIQEQVDHITYWHVELESHDVLFANGMPAESYLEMGNRCFFAQGEIVAFDTSPDRLPATHADFCHPFHAQGVLVEAIRAQLRARAERLGWRLVDRDLDDLHIVADGVRLRSRHLGHTMCFILPAAARDVWLISEVTIPAEIADSPDRRQLGACLHALVISDGSGVARRVAADDPRLCVGFHDVERDASLCWRWTAGRARLPASLWNAIESEIHLQLDLAEFALPRWVEPQDTGMTTILVA